MGEVQLNLQYSSKEPVHLATILLSFPCTIHSALPFAACELFQELAGYEEVQHPVMTGLINLLQPLRDTESGHTRDTAHSTGKKEKEGKKGDRNRKL